MKGFKVISEADDSYHMQHDNGRKFTVDKKGLSKKAHEVIKKMCGGGRAMADGGDVEGEDDEINAIENEISAKPAPQETNPDQEAPAAASSSAVTAPAAAPVNTGPIANNPAQSIQQYGTNASDILDQRIKDVQDYQKTKEAADAASDEVREDTIHALLPEKKFGLATIAPSPGDIEANMEKSDTDFMEQLQKKQDAFDPNRYWHGMDTPHRILAGIALAIGGAGVGRNGTSLAAEHLNQSINNDIEKQKADITNTQNLWSMNHKAQGDEMTATLNTRNQLMSVAQLQLAQQAANATNAKDKLNAQTTLSDLQQQKALNNRAIGMLSQRQPGPGGQLSTDPTIIASQLIQDPNQRAAAIKEIEQNQNVEKGRQFALDSFDKLTSNTVTGGAHTPERKSIVNALALDIAKRFNIRPSNAVDMADEMLPGAGLTGMEMESTVNDKRARLNQLFDMQKSEMGVLKSTTGLGPDDFPSTSSNPLSKLDKNKLAQMTPQERKLYDVARANPDHPESQKFLKKFRAGQ